jgi:hypothetical protein
MFIARTMPSFRRRSEEREPSPFLQYATSRSSERRLGFLHVASYKHATPVGVKHVDVPEYSSV